MTRLLNNIISHCFCQSKWVQKPCKNPRSNNIICILISKNGIVQPGWTSPSWRCGFQWEQLDQFISFMKHSLAWHWALSWTDSFHIITKLTDAIFSQTARAGHVSTDGNFQLLIAIWAHWAWTMQVLNYFWFSCDWVQHMMRNWHMLLQCSTSWARCFPRVPNTSTPSPDSTDSTQWHTPVLTRLLAFLVMSI